MKFHNKKLKTGGGNLIHGQRSRAQHDVVP